MISIVENNLQSRPNPDGDIRPAQFITSQESSKYRVVLSV